MFYSKVASREKDLPQQKPLRLRNLKNLVVVLGLAAQEYPNIPRPLTDSLNLECRTLNMVPPFYATVGWVLQNSAVCFTSQTYSTATYLCTFYICKPQGVPQEGIFNEPTGSWIPCHALVRKTVSENITVTGFIGRRNQVYLLCFTFFTAACWSPGKDGHHNCNKLKIPDSWQGHPRLVELRKGISSVYYRHPPQTPSSTTYEALEHPHGPV